MLRLFAWSGGALFVTALAWSVYFYAVVLANTAEPGTFASHASIDVALFLLFAAHHSLLARETVKRAVTRIRRIVAARGGVKTLAAQQTGGDNEADLDASVLERAD